jgi:site-specific recombinase XerD
LLFGAGDEIRTRDLLLGKQTDTLKLLNKLTVSELAELSKLSKAYISQVKHGKRPPSKSLLDALANTTPTKPREDYIALFIQSRQSMNVSPNTLKLYRYILQGFESFIDPVKATRTDIERYLSGIKANGISLGNRHAHYRVLKTFFRWLEGEHGVNSPMQNIKAPRLPKLILPSLTNEQVLEIMSKAESTRNRAIIALAVESGLRVSELANIRLEDIDFQTKVIRTLGKGNKEAYAPFGELSQSYLNQWLMEYHPNGNVWGINKQGIQTMLRRLETTTGLPCNPHTFRRTFACLLRKAGVDSMTIKDLGRWESLEMVQRYTRSVTFQDSLKFYKAPLGTIT